MAWNYRIIKDEDTGQLSIREVFYNEGGGIYAYTRSPVGIVSETRDGVIQVLAVMLKDIASSEILSEPIKFEDIDRDE